MKTFYGYPANVNLNSEAAINASISLKTSSDLINDSYPGAEYSQVDFKELFIYKVLEFIELGSKICLFYDKSIFKRWCITCIRKSE